MSKNFNSKKKQVDKELLNITDNLLAISGQTKAVADELQKKTKRFSENSQKKINAVKSIITNTDISSDIIFLKEESRKSVEKDQNSSFFNQVSGIADILKDEFYLKVQDELNLYKKIQKIKKSVIKKLPESEKKKSEEVFDKKMNKATDEIIFGLVNEELKKDFYQALPKIQSILDLFQYEEVKNDIKKLVYDKIRDNYPKDNYLKDNKKNDVKALKSTFDNEYRSKNLFNTEFQKSTFANHAITNLLENYKNYEAEIYHDFTIKNTKSIDELEEKFPSCGLKKEMISNFIKKLDELYEQDKEVNALKCKDMIEKVLPLLPFERVYGSSEYKRKEKTDAVDYKIGSVLEILKKEDNRINKLLLRGPQIAFEKTVDNAGKIASATLSATGDIVVAGLDATLSVAIPVAEATGIAVNKTLDVTGEISTVTLDSAKSATKSVSKFFSDYVLDPVAKAYDSLSENVDEVKVSINRTGKKFAKETSKQVDNASKAISDTTVNIANVAKDSAEKVATKSVQGISIGVITVAGVAVEFCKVVKSGGDDLLTSASRNQNKFNTELSVQSSGIVIAFNNAILATTNIIKYSYEGIKHVIELCHQKIKESNQRNPSNVSPDQEMDFVKNLPKIFNWRNNGGRGFDR